MFQRATAENAVPRFLKLQIGKDCDEVCIATAFTDAVNRTLNLLATGIDRGQRQLGRTSGS